MTNRLNFNKVGHMFDQQPGQSLLNRCCDMSVVVIVLIVIMTLLSRLFQVFPVGLINELVVGYRPIHSLFLYTLLIQPLPVGKRSSGLAAIE